MTDLVQSSAECIARRVSQGELDAASVLESFLERTRGVEPRIRAYIRQDEALARRRAASIDQRRERGESLGALAGVPVAVKDNISIAELPLTCGSRVLEGYVAPYSATAIERLLAADAVVVGQTNMDEFGMGSSCENSASHATRNPWDLNRVPGGSSGGSAAAVAANAAPLALGTDTGGSIRQPAALCGVVGLKPTYGRVSRYGLVAFASSLDQIGPLCSNVRDAALALNALAGFDPLDSTSADLPVDDYLDGIENGIEGLRVAVVEEIEAEASQELVGMWNASLDMLRKAGVELVPVSVPTVRAAIAAYYVLANCEASANLARFDGLRYGRRATGDGSLAGAYFASRSEGFGPEVKRRILLGTFALSSGYYDAYYGQAARVTRQMKSELQAVFERVDAIALPTSPGAAFTLGERLDDPLTMYLSDIYTTPASLAGLPALALPCALNDAGLPLSLQFLGPPFREARLLRMGRTIEKLRGDFPRPDA